jgi:DNA-binding MarR family transcriptional regulator
MAAMDNLIEDFKRYLKEALDVSTAPAKWEQEKRLPFFLQDLYRFFECSFLETRCLLMMTREQKEQTPAVVRKHLDQVRRHWNGELIYLHPSISTYNRKRLIQQKVPFVVPGNQMYLPMLAIDFREHIRKGRRVASLLSPSTQTLILLSIYNPGEETFTPSIVADRLGYSAMTLTRAFNELESIGLAEVSTQGRERVLSYRWAGRDLWENAKEKMRSPVKKRFYMKPSRETWRGITAGLTALSHFSLLAPPANPVYAVSAAEFKSLKNGHEIFDADGLVEPEFCEVEVWNYPPALFASNNVVDRCSLYISLKDNTDERVQSALDKMMESISW